MSQPINIPGFAQLVERLTAELDCRDRTNTQGLKNLRNEDTVYAMQTARPSPGSDGHVNGGSVSSRRRKNSVPNLYFRAKYIEARIKCFFVVFSLLVFRTHVETTFEFFGFTLESVWCTFSQGLKIIRAIQRKLRQIFIVIRISCQNLCLLCFINDFENEASKELCKEIFYHLLNCETKQEQEVVFRFKLLMQTDTLVLSHGQL